MLRKTNVRQLRSGIILKKKIQKNMSEMHEWTGFLEWQLK